MGDANNDFERIHSSTAKLLYHSRFDISTLEMCLEYHFLRKTKYHENRLENESFLMGKTVNTSADKTISMTSSCNCEKQNKKVLVQHVEAQLGWGVN